MGYDFDRETNRFHTNNFKWDKLQERYGRTDILPFWIADMEFETAPEIVESLVRRSQHGIFGYSFKPDSYYEAFIKWESQRHGWQIKKEWITGSPGVMSGLSILIESLTKPGDNIVILSPAYTGFYEKIRQNGRNVVTSSLCFQKGSYSIDFTDLERVAAKNRDGLFIFCNPHNPSGRVWKEEELKTLLSICEKHNLKVISDDIHCDIVYSRHHYIPLASLAGGYGDHIITCTAPGKTFNLTGIATSFIVIPDAGMRETFTKALDRLELTDGNLFGNLAAEAAYEKGGPWADALCDYLEGNRDYVIGYLRKEKLPVEPVCPEGTYMMLLDVRAIGADEDIIKKRMIDEAGLLLNQGGTFGEETKGFARFNFACQRKLLHEGLERLKKLF